MSYIGNEPTSVAFLTDTFSGNGSTTAFTLSAAPAGTSSILVAISGVVQDPSTYSVVGTTLTFSPAPPTGTGNISVRFLGIPASGVTTTAYRTVTEFTATAGQTTFSVPSYTPGFIDVYRNGVLLGSADYTASNGVSVVLVNACTAGDLVEVISMSVSSVLNAMPTTGGTFSGNVLFNSGSGIWNTSGNVGVGTASPNINTNGTVLHINNNTASRAAMLHMTNGSSGSTATDGLIVGKWSDNDNYFWDYEAQALVFGTNSTERMRINASGQVTMPAQPAFLARSNEAGGNITTTGVIPYQVVVVNTGSNYSTLTNRFTAPVAGRYVFMAQVPPNTTPSEFRITKNAGTVVKTQGGLLSNNSNTGICTMTCVIDLSANDFVDVRMDTGSRFAWGSDNGFAYFSGYLIG